MKTNKFLPAMLFLSIIVLLFSCKKDYSFEGGIQSHGSIIKSATSNNCIATVNGAYNAGAALTAADNYIFDSINVTSPGLYVITTDTINGVWFRATGKFDSVGRFAVKLTGRGTPVTNGTFNYTLTYDSTSCTVPVFVDVANTGGASYYIKATVAGTALEFNARYSDISMVTVGILSIAGAKANTGTADSIYIKLTNLSNNSIIIGNYSNTGGAQYSSCTYTDAALNVYTTSILYPFNVTISAFTPTQVTGTFSGILVDSGGATLSITYGSFSVGHL